MAFEDDPAYLSGNVQWLDTISGSNANSGALPELPVLTLAQAVTNSAANGLIVIGAGSAETLTVQQVFALAGLSVWGCGSGSTRPRYTVGANAIIFSATAAGIRFRNLYFPQATTGGAASGKITVTAASCEVRDCYFECGAADIGAGAVQLGASSSNARIEGSTFITTALRPTVGLAVAAAVTDVEVRDCIFDGGSFGWSDYALKVSAAATRVRGENNRYLRRADLGHTVTATSYQHLKTQQDGTGNVLLTA